MTKQNTARRARRSARQLRDGAQPSQKLTREQREIEIMRRVVQFRKKAYQELAKH